MLVSSAPYVDQPRTPERGEMNKAEKSLNILPKSMRWAPELLAAHSEFCAEIRQRIGDADQHARVPSGSLHPSDDFEKSGSYWSNFRSVNMSDQKKRMFVIVDAIYRTLTIARYVFIGHLFVSHGLVKTC